MNLVELGPLVKSIDIRRAPADAFRLFTEEISAWWPMRQHSRARDAAGEITMRVDFEPFVGGRLYETLNTGEERDWGEVLAIEPGRSVRFSFSMGRPKAKSGEVEVRFEPLGDAACRVTLTHSHWERMEHEADRLRHAFAHGWDAVFVEAFGQFADGTSNMMG